MATSMPARPDAGGGATPPTPGKGKGLPVWVLVLLVLAGFYFYNQFVSGGGVGKSGSHTTYKVSGALGSASVTYQTGSQDSAQDTNVSIPWTRVETMGSGDFYYVSAQNQGGGTIGATVSVDGRLRSRAARCSLVPPISVGLYCMGARLETDPFARGHCLCRNKSSVTR